MEVSTHLCRFSLSIELFCLAFSHLCFSLGLCNRGERLLVWGKTAISKFFVGIKELAMSGYPFSFSIS